MEAHNNANFDMYGGRPNIYTENETDRIIPGKIQLRSSSIRCFYRELDAKVPPGKLLTKEAEKLSQRLMLTLVQAALIPDLV